MKKIVVLFGSFNPLTNAHVAAMKAAVESVNACKGLFVATNGKYLQRKAVKINDPFYLTEDERREIIERTCESEPALSFWGYELGGINPRRYKTLCKIQAQYPDAEIYEVQGADKVPSVARFACAEEYVSNIRFVVFSRNGVDVNQLISANPLLSRFKDHYTILPPLEGNISSTEVRKRFYSNGDYSHLIPPAAVKVLKEHSPSDFSISYEDRMKTIMSSGRYGANRACKQVYLENTALFNDWKKKSLSDYMAFIDGAKLYKTEYRVNDVGTVYPFTEVGCINADCVDVAEYLIKNGYNPAILNLASAGRPGGGYDRGMMAQEESLCQCSNLSLALYSYGDPRRMKCVRDSGVPRKVTGYPLDMNYGGIYTPNVTFFRNNRSKYFTRKTNPFKCDVITVAALSFNGRSDFAKACEQNYRSESGGFTPDGEAIMLNKIRTIFRMGVEHSKDALVLGAFGNGAYKLPVKDVALLFKRVMNESEFKGKFKLITFAILEPTRRPNGVNGKFAPYYNEFGSFALN